MMLLTTWPVLLAFESQCEDCAERRGGDNLSANLYPVCPLVELRRAASTLSRPPSHLLNSPWWQEPPDYSPRLAGGYQTCDSLSVAGLVIWEGRSRKAKRCLRCRIFLEVYTNEVGTCEEWGELCEVLMFCVLQPCEMTAKRVCQFVVLARQVDRKKLYYNWGGCFTTQWENVSTINNLTWDIFTQCGSHILRIPQLVLFMQCIFPPLCQSAHTLLEQALRQY